MSRPSPRMRLTSPAPSTPITPRGGSPLPSGSPSASSPSTPSRSGPGGENTYQRTFRAISKNVEVIQGNWTTLSLKISDSFARIERLRAAAKDKPAGIDPAERRVKHQKQVKALEDEQVYLLQQYEKMVTQSEQLKKNSKKAEELLMEMSKRKGFEAAFAEPLFLTWPLARFVDALAAFTNIFRVELNAYERQIELATSETAGAVSKILDEEETKPMTKLWNSRKSEFMDICEVELTPLPASNG